MRIHRGWALAAVATLLAGAAVPATTATATAAPAIRAIDLGTLASDGVSGDSSAWDISDDGLVIGRSYDENWKSHAFLWRSGKMVDLLAEWPDVTSGESRHVSARNGWILGEYRKNADGVSRQFLWHDGELLDPAELPEGPLTFNAVNSSGLVSGWAGPRDSRRAILWQAGRVTDVDADIDCDGLTSAGTLNDRGQVIVVCSSEFEDLSFHVWRNGQVTDLPVPAGDTVEEVWDINERGEVIGQLFNGSRSRLVMWRDGRLIETGVGTARWANSLNDRGDVVGRFGTATGEHGYLWSNGTRTDLGEGVATGINNRRQVALYTRVGEDEWNGPTHAYVWQNGTRTKLPLPAGVDPDGSSTAYEINNRGQIIGSLTENDHAVLWLT